MPDFDSIGKPLCLNLFWELRDRCVNLRVKTMRNDHVSKYETKLYNHFRWDIEVLEIKNRHGSGLEDALMNKYLILGVLLNVLSTSTIQLSCVHIFQNGLRQSLAWEIMGYNEEA